MLCVLSQTSHMSIFFPLQNLARGMTNRLAVYSLTSLEKRRAVKGGSAIHVLFPLLRGMCILRRSDESSQTCRAVFFFGSFSVGAY